MKKREEVLFTFQLPGERTIPFFFLSLSLSRFCLPRVPIFNRATMLGILARPIQ